MLLTLESVVAGYGGGDVLRGVDLDVEEGGITCVVGPNGAGKSTVLRAISGLLKPSRGSITFDGMEISGMTPRHALARGIVQIPQERSLFPQMTVRRNVELGAYTIRDRALVRKRLDAVVEMFPLVKERANDKAGSLSGGQQKIIEFARGLMLDPRLVLLDEPSMGLDPKTLRSVFEKVKLMKDAGKTILLVEQNARSGLGISDHGLVMEGGTVRLSGPASTILENPEVGTLYLGGALAS
ncbi:MAG: ABC transporter ATP-binding protein [Chloroflexota bacterium]